MISNAWKGVALMNASSGIRIGHYFADVTTWSRMPHPILHVEVSPDGRHLAIAGPRPRGQPQLLVASVESGAVEWELHEDQLDGWPFSADMADRDVVYIPKWSGMRLVVVLATLDDFVNDSDDEEDHDTHVGVGMSRMAIISFGDSAMLAY